MTVKQHDGTAVTDRRVAKVLGERGFDLALMNARDLWRAAVALVVAVIDAGEGPGTV